MKYNKSKIMKQAHKTYKMLKTQGSHYTFSEALMLSWIGEKRLMKPELYHVFD